MAKNKMNIAIVEDNSGKILAELGDKKQKLFHAWGVKWKEIVTPLVPVDTGRLRQSMHFRSLKDRTAVGTNVKYAPFINNGFRSYKGKKYMEHSTLEKRDIYKRILEQILKE